jgi:hypothetical protein
MAANVRDKNLDLEERPSYRAFLDNNNNLFIYKAHFPNAQMR